MKLLKDTFRQRMGIKFSYVLILIILVLPMTATAFDITGPMAITEPGTYNLQVDILNQASGIQIYSSDVIIEGNGHTIDGMGSSGTGILIGGLARCIRTSRYRISCFPIGCLGSPYQ